FLRLFLQCYVHPPALHSFPTRRSSDLASASARSGSPSCSRMPKVESSSRATESLATISSRNARATSFSTMLALERPIAALMSARSEEHTSELQSRENLVCRLLLEKKKK